MAVAFRFAGAMTALLVGVMPASAQRNAPATYAITDARLVPVGAPVIAKGTIVVRNGLIAAMGPSVPVPADARVIDGAGLTVYPGFIDAYSSLGIASTGGGGGRGGGGGAPAAPAAPASNSPYPAGLQPEVTAVELLRPEGDVFVAPHAAGVTTALTAPSNGIFQGQSAVINLATGELATLVMRTGVAQHIGFTPLRSGGFPNSLMGVFASIRQMLLDAQQYRAALAAYDASPVGQRRPEYDASLAALQPVLTKQQPVVMYAMTQREIERALDLAAEFDLKVVIAGGREAQLVADRLKAADVPVLLSANFPRRPAGPVSPDADPEPVRALRERAEAPKTAGVLAAKGVRFALIGGGATWTEHLANVRKAIEAGLSADAALKALTTTPAALLGVADRTGSLAVGKIANLTITTGDIFNDAGARVSQVLVDGVPYQVRSSGGNATAAAPTATGAWTINVSLEGQEHAVTFTLRQEGGRLTGTLQGALGTTQIADGSIGADGEFSFNASVTLKDGTETAQFRGNQTNDTIRGRVTIVGHAAGTFAGTRPRSGGPGAPRQE